MTIKQLYNELIENWTKYDYHRSFTVPGWYKNYCDFYNQTMIMRSRLATGYELDEYRDIKFLMQLIYERQNSIANVGFSFLEWDDFKKLIKSRGYFMNALSEVILRPSATNIEPLAVEWHNLLGKKNPLRINRIAAACTHSISSTANIPDFNRVFTFLVNRNVISKPSRLSGGKNFEWFKKNEHLMRELHQIFKSEIKSGKTDPIKLSIFVWELQYSCKKKRPLLNKYLPPSQSVFSPAVQKTSSHP